MNKKKKALITGITGQDGFYLTELLVQQHYDVYGLIRPGSIFKTAPPELFFLYGDLRDDNSIKNLYKTIIPDEVYNLAAQSSVSKSFKDPDITFDINYNGAGRVIVGAMEANPRVKIYQASSCEMFGSSPPPQNEETPFDPLSPYAESKVRAHNDFVKHLRQKYGLFVCSGILFHHESPRRAEEFVSKKIINSLVRIKRGKQKILELGNLSAAVDWGYAPDYVRAMWLMLQQSEPDDYVIASGESHTVREFVNKTAVHVGINLNWEGEGDKEIARDIDGNCIIKVNKEFFRPTDPKHFLGDASKAKRKLGWSPKVNFDNLVKILVENELHSDI